MSSTVLKHVRCSVAIKLTVLDSLMARIGAWVTEAVLSTMEPVFELLNWQKKNQLTPFENHVIQIFVFS